MKRLFVLLTILIFGAFLLSGCMAYPLASTAVYGFTAFKSAQGISRGDLETRFEKNDLLAEDKQILSSIKRIAVYPPLYPVSNEATALAEVLSKNKEYDIVSPYSVREALSKLGGVANLEEMLEDERIQHLYQVCKTLKADGLFILATKQGELKTNVLSFKRTEIGTDFRAELFSKKYRKVVWKQQGTVVLKVGAKTPGDKEINKIMAEAIAKKFLSDAESKPTASVSSPSYLTTISRCNIREEPSLEGKIIKTVDIGTKLEKVAEVNKWINIKFDNGKTGYIYGSLVKESSN